MPVTSLQFTNVGPFDDIQFEFDPQVNVFTGPNNAGKSTTLMVLGEIIVYPFALPTKLLRSGEASWNLRLLLGKEEQSHQGSFPSRIDEIKDLLEHLGYSTFVPALRRSTDYRSQGPSASPDRQNELMLDQTLQWVERNDPKMVRERGLEDIRQAIRQSISDSGREATPDLKKRRSLLLANDSLVSDEAVIQKVVELDYQAYLEERPTIRELISSIGTIASQITEGFPIEFQGIKRDEGGYFPQFRTPDGDMPLNVLSQGTQSIIQWVAHLLIGYAEYYDFPPNLEEKPGILIIDEIDAHLHPSWQRRIIPTLTKHFPNLQIFCSTHSPLMLAGLKAGQVQLLRRDEKGKVTVSRNETDIVGWSADEILRNFLDVSSPTDLQTVGHIERLRQLRSKNKLSRDEAEELERLRHTVNQDLLAGPIAAQVEHFAEVLKQARTASAIPTEPVRPTSRTTRRRRKPTE
jgi:hypothetical protein